LNQNRALDSYFDAFSSRDPAPTSLENALVLGVRERLRWQRVALTYMAAHVTNAGSAAIVAGSYAH
jgi:hypothetical protein